MYFFSYFLKSSLFFFFLKDNLISIFSLNYNMYFFFTLSEDLPSYQDTLVDIYSYPFKYFKIFVLKIVYDVSKFL